MIRLVTLLALALLQGLLYPKASRVQWFGNRFAGSKINPNVVVWHTTETGTWPGYSDGATAPHFTILANLKTRKLEVRQHFDTLVSARALRNLAGGVETNTLNAIQIELVGTCTTAYRDRYGYLFWPDAPEWALTELGLFARWLAETHPGYKLRDAAPRGWLPYPRSYANGAGQRMSFEEWRAAVGNVGHQHVPENVHGDPGALDMAFIVAAARGDESPSNPPTEAAKPSKIARARGLLRDALREAREARDARKVARVKAALRALRGK